MGVSWGQIGLDLVLALALGRECGMPSIKTAGDKKRRLIDY